MKAKTVAARLISGLRRELREFLFLRDARACAQAMPGQVRDRALTGKHRLRTADALCHPCEVEVAHWLYREATRHLADAWLRERQTESSAAADAPRRFEALRTRLIRHGISAPIVAQVRRLMGDEDSSAGRGDSLGKETRPDLYQEADAVHVLADLVETRTVGALRALSVLRIAVASIFALALLVGSALWIGQPVNLALHQPVLASGHDFGTQPEDAVDGIRYGQLGFHSAKHSSPWLRVDLGRPTVINRIVAFGRSECCFDQSIPLAIEVSDDGTNFEQVVERTVPFTQYAPWATSLPSVKARYVRFHTLRESYIVLSEVEVYGHPL